MNNKKKRGFALMDPERRRKIASLGGKAVQRNGTGHRFQEGSEEARAAGRKGRSAQLAPA